MMTAMSPMLASFCPGLGSGVAALAAPLTLGSDDQIKMMVVGGGLILVAVLAVLHTVKKTTEVHEREKTRREIAAYVAEGSITPEDAQRLLAAGLNEQVAQELARGVTWGTISANKAKQVAEAFQQPGWGAPPPGGAATPPPRG